MSVGVTGSIIDCDSIGDGFDTHTLDHKNKELYMKYLLLLFPILTFAGEHDMKCETVKSPDFSFNKVRRCENKEVICYESVITGFQCKFKEKVKATGKCKIEGTELVCR